MLFQISVINFQISEIKLESKDVLPKINRTQAAKMTGKRRFCPW